MKSIRQLVIEVVSGMLGLPEADLNTRSPLSHLPHPFDTVELVMAIEEAFGIELSNQETEGMKCLDDLIQTVEERLGGDPGISATV
jgi:acyl carrier protein